MVCQLVSWSVGGWSVGLLVGRSVSVSWSDQLVGWLVWLVGQLVGWWSVSRPVGLSVSVTWSSQSVGQQLVGPVSWSVGRLVAGQLVGRLVGWSVSWLVGWSVGWSVL